MANIVHARACRLSTPLVCLRSNGRLVDSLLKGARLLFTVYYATAYFFHRTRCNVTANVS